MSSIDDDDDNDNDNTGYDIEDPICAGREHAKKEEIALDPPIPFFPRNIVTDKRKKTRG